MTDPRRRSTAIHEAGHAVAAIALRRKFRSVTIVPAGESLGHVRITPPKHDASLQSHFDHLVRLMAGNQAQRSFGYNPSLQSASADQAAAMDHAEAISGSFDEAKLWKRLATMRANSLVKQWRASIEAVADALIEAGTLDYEQVRRIAHKAKGLMEIG